MLRADNSQANKVLSALEGLGLSDGETEIAREYLDGEAGEEVLAGLTHRNMTSYFAVKYRVFQEFFTSCLKKKQYGKASRTFRLLYAIGSYSCCDCFENPDTFMDVVEKGCMDIDREKAVAVAAQHTFLQVYRLASNYKAYLLTTRRLERLAEFADRNPEIILRAWKEFDDEQLNGRILLMALYFYLRYDREGHAVIGFSAGQDGKPEEKLKPETGIRGSAEDQALLEEYEETLTESLGRILKAEAARKKEIQDIQKGIRQGKFDDSLLQGMRNWAVNAAVFDLVANCASVNYMLSGKLRNVLRVCGALNPSELLDALVRVDLREEIGNMAGKMEELFGISDQNVMSWIQAVLNGFQKFGVPTEKVKKEILPAQYRKNPQLYLLTYEKAELDEGNALAGAIRDEDPEIYQRMVLPKAAAQRDRIISWLTGKETCARECRDYLEGQADLSTLYAIRGKLSPDYYRESDARKALEKYFEAYQDEDFYARCMAYMALRGMAYFFSTGLIGSRTEAPREVLEHTFRSLALAGVDLADQVQVVCLMVDSEYSEEKKASITRICIPVFRQYLAERPGEMESAFAKAGAYGRYFALLVYGGEAQVWQAQILSYSQDNSKQVRQELEKLLTDHPDWRPQIIELLSSKKAVEREMGIRVLAGWNTPQDREVLQALYEREKNAKIRMLLDNVLGHDSTKEGGNGGMALTKEDLVKSLHRGGKKRSLAWAYETPFSPVHTQKGGQATEEYLQALLLCYCSMTKPGINNDAALLAENLNPQELAAYVGELFDKWMEGGAEAKKRWVLYAASIHGGSEIVKRLHHQIQEWPQNARGAIAAEAVQALALSPQPQALLIVDGIARKFKFKQVKAAAGQALEFAASQLGLTREQLEDKIVPSLGFDEHMERRFDYGNRSFTVTITPALEMKIYDESGKKLKNMPAPGTRDDAEKAAASYAEFKEMKKQMKATVSSQKQRLEMALSAERLWTVPAWQELFVHNPIMHQFAIGLIWGVYEEHKLVRSFRYMEDGSFNTEDEEEYILPGAQLDQSESAPQGQPGTLQGQIGLVHPIELSRESLETWQQQLEDYEILQPIEQLNREVYRLTQEEQECKSLERFGGMLINDLSLGGKLAALGWYRGSVLDAGGFYTYYREDVSLGLGAELHFSGSFVGSGSMGGEEVTVYDVRFYKAGTIERGSYSYDAVEGEKRIPLKDIPPRYFSEIVWQLTKATASSKDRNEDWKTEIR